MQPLDQDDTDTEAAWLSKQSNNKIIAGQPCKISVLE